MNALLKLDEQDDIPLTEDELRRALAGTKTTAPGDDGLTYQVLHLIQKVPGNLLLHLFNLCFRQGYVPSAWTSSIIVPIPKPGTDKFRPISLTSCFSKVLERILLARLMHRLQDKLSPSLYGFLPQRSTHHCLVELYTRLSSTSVVAFLDLKSAFDIANREIILDQLVDFGIQGNLLRWIRGFLSNRASCVMFRGFCSSYELFELGTPQGGVLSPFLFNVLMHRLLSLIPAIPGTTVTCYADDICIHSTSPQDLQLFLHNFYVSSVSCGLIISPDKSRIFSYRNFRALPVFTMGGNVIPHCTQYIPGAPVRSLQPYLHDNGFTPSKALKPLENFQNRAMRFILGCPPSTRIVNMQSELDLPPLVERIYANVTYLSIKCLHSPILAPHFSAVIRTSLDPDAPRLPLRPGGHNLISEVCNNLRGIGVNVPEEAAIPDLPPWRVPLPDVTFTPTSKDALPLLQKQLDLETITRVSVSVPAAHHIYVDGSVQADGSAACAVFSPTMEPPVDGEWRGRRLPNSSSSTFCELHGILDAVMIIVQQRVNGIIVCDSQSALQALSSARPSCGHVVQEILCQLATAHDASLIISFVWTPSHIGLIGNDKVDRLAKEACALDLDDATALPSLRCFRISIFSAAHAITTHRRNAERTNSVSIQHHDHFLQSPYKYRQHGLMVRRHNVVSARLRLGYRPVWQVSQAEDVPRFSSCKLCNRPNANTLDHYCLHCPAVTNLLPQGQTLLQICKHLLTDDNLDVLLARHPHFGGC
ncbi:uncharacterized protein LOC122265711 [Penaeus japonicus]|uniref:uncharacterized protein LOC122265711 n=1 Tax=Penaeus japonicus TaxID=27405 RepID=UPI001C70BB5A|nr:uncharacterized protein LOC122265711 [Penaeus japonicus]